VIAVQVVGVAFVEGDLAFVAEADFAFAVVGILASVVYGRVASAAVARRIQEQDHNLEVGIHQDQLA